MVEEYLDIYNEDGSPSGRKAEKKQVHQQGLWHRAVHVWFINSKQELLLQLRSHLVDNHPSKWDISAAGHVSANESDLTSALREAKEELGVVLRPEQLILIGTVKQQSERLNYINKEFNSVFIVKIDLAVSQFKKQVEEVDDLQWRFWREIENKIDNNDPEYVPHPNEYQLLFDYLKS